MTADLVFPMAAVPPNFAVYENALTIDVPADPSLAGATLYGQWFSMFQQCGFVGCDYQYVITSDAAQISLGA